MYVKNPVVLILIYIATPVLLNAQHFNINLGYCVATSKVRAVNDYDNYRINHQQFKIQLNYRHEITEIGINIGFGKRPILINDIEENYCDYGDSPNGSYYNNCDYRITRFESEKIFLDNSISLGFFLNNKEKIIKFIPRFSLGVSWQLSRTDISDSLYDKHGYSSYDAISNQYSSSATYEYYKASDYMYYGKHIGYFEFCPEIRVSIKQNIYLTLTPIFRRYFSEIFKYGDYFSITDLMGTVSIGWKFYKKSDTSH